MNRVTVEVEISSDMLRHSKKVKEERLTKNMAQQFDLKREEQKLRTDIMAIGNWLHDRKN